MNAAMFYTLKATPRAAGQMGFIIDDNNRNYFFGFESFFFSLWNIVIPILVGGFLALIDGKTILGMVFSVNTGYKVITVMALLIAIAACLVLSRF